MGISAATSGNQRESLQAHSKTAGAGVKSLIGDRHDAATRRRCRKRSRWGLCRTNPDRSTGAHCHPYLRLLARVVARPTRASQAMRAEAHSAEPTGFDLTDREGRLSWPISCASGIQQLERPTPNPTCRRSYLITSSRRNAMRRFFGVLIVSLFAFAPPAVGDGHAPKVKEQPLVLFPEKGRHHHPIATKNAEAQKWFDQGMTWYWGFNHAEAVRCFMRAAELEPKSPMPFWGIALELGPNYNRDIDPLDAMRKQKAYAAAQKAVELSEGAAAHEVAYARAAAKRYPEDPAADGRKFEEAYRDAMREVAKTYPHDPDAATLHAEAILNLTPWKLWSKKGEPAEGTQEAVRVLESVMERWPDHIGANHYHIHAVEASRDPGRGLTSARRLVGLTPWAGHLVHMGSHIFIHTGDYEEAAACNDLAARADEEFMRLSGVKSGTYAMMYYPHN